MLFSVKVLFHVNLFIGLFISQNLFMFTFHNVFNFHLKFNTIYQSAVDEGQVS